MVERCPFFSLAGILKIEATATPNPKVIVIDREGQPMAFEISRMLGQQEVVVRPLEDPLVKTAGVAGTTDLGDGRPVLVLDLAALGAAASSEAA